LLGDTAQSPFGIGARASRTAVVSGGALSRAAQQVREKLVRIAAFLLEAGVDDVVLQEGAFHVRGAPDQRVTLMQVAEAAYFSPAVRAVDPEPMLSATAFYDPKATYSNGCIAVQCEVDPETGLVELLRLGAAEDCGTVLNPSIVEGQVQGAVAQGVGGALFEDIVYDDEGQLLTASMMDYLLPGATEMTDLSIQHLESPSPFTVGGVKGMGESGLLATPAAVANAVLNALGLPVTDDVRLPLTPERVRNLAKSTREHPAPITGLRETGPGAPAEI
jgi:aerobic carbon-monoxide dehydrogenase large subunit